MSGKIFNLRKSGFEIRAAKDKKKAEVILYASIGESWWGDSVSAKQFSDTLKTVGEVDELDIRINSPGGDVFDGMTIYNRLKQHKAKKTVYIDGMAASIASIIALAGDDIVIGEGAAYMIHLPWTFAMGNRNDLDNTVNLLIDIEEQMVGLYQRKTKIPRTEIKTMLEKETWLFGSEAVEKGFVDRTMEESIPVAASILDKASWMKNKPKNILTDAKAAKASAELLKNKIAATLARK